MTMIINCIRVESVKSPARVAAVVAAGVLVLAGCSTATTEPDSSAGAASAALTVATAFYPLQFVADEVGGDLVSTFSMTPAGVEPHDIELSPAAVRQLGTADLALYLSGFQPAVDDAIATTGVEALDAASVVELHDAEQHADEAAGDGHASSDPHFWLDPHLLAEYADAVGEAFAASDPANASTYTANATALHDELDALDATYATGLATCQRDTIVVSHEAFGYLAEAYGLQQEGISGLDPESEPSPARLLEVKDIITQTGTTTVFTESLVSARAADALAAELGVTTAVLDPIENVVDGDDYIQVMTRNLAALETALGCD